MRKLSVVFYQRDFTTPLSFPRVKIIPSSMSWDAVGGCDKAHLTAYGNFNALWEMTNWLRAPVEIKDWRGEKVWWGFINEAYVQVGSIKLGVSLDAMSNKIAIAYTSNGGQLQRFTTPWAQDTLSTSTYGIIEFLTTLNNGNEETALALRDTLLAEKSLPIAIPEITDGQGSMSAGLELSGWFNTLRWRYYQQTAGLEGDDETGQGVQEVGKETANQKIAQGFKTSTSWDAVEIGINAKKEGSPTDNLVLDICSDNAGIPGAVITSISIPSANLPTSLSWVWVAPSSPIPLTADVQYWIVVRRSGALDATNFYKTNLNEELSYTGGVFRIYDGAAWVVRDPDADMNFLIKGAQETTLQIKDIVAASGQFMTGTVIKNASGKSSNQYRDGDNQALQEVTDLLRIGTANSRRLLATVTPGRELIVYEEPPYDPYTTDYFIDVKGKLTNRWGKTVLEHTGPVAGWCQMKDIFPPQFNSQLLADGTRFFIERYEFDVQNWKGRPEPKSIKSGWDVGSINEG